MSAENPLSRSQVFKGLTEDEVNLFTPLREELTVERGESIFREGNPARYLFVVEEGRVALTMTLSRPDGSVTHPTTVASLGPLEAFGWSSLVEPRVLRFSAVAVEPSRVTRLDGRSLQAVMEEHPSVGYRVMVNLTQLLGSRLARTREAFVNERDWTFRQELDALG